MNSIVQNLKNLGWAKLSVLGGIGLGLLLTLLFGFQTLTAPAMSPIYSGLAPSDSAQIVRSLEQAGVIVEVSPDGSVINIPRDEFARARMLLAEQGLPSAGSTGWELFDQTSSIGMTSFMQKVNRLRALEGELARSVQTIKGVESARVHLVLPEREAFSRERPEATASVIIRTSGGFSIEKSQALSIRHLVSSAVPDLAPSRVTVLSADGAVILADDSSAQPGEVGLQGIKAAMEERYARSIEQMLTARVGAGNARVQVTVELDNEREVVRSENFNPEEQVVRSTETNEENEQSSEANQSNVSVETNLPPDAQGSGAPGSQTARNATNEIVNYEIGNTITERVREPGSIKKISVAVLVNGIYERDDAGEVQYQDRSPEEIARLSDLVKSSIAFDEARGDIVSVDSLRFIDYSMEVSDAVGPSIMDILSENIMTIIQWVMATIIVALVLTLGVRPVVARVFPEIIPQTAEAKTDEQLAAEGQQQADGQSAGGQGGVQQVSDAVEESKKAEEEDDRLVQLMSVKGGVRMRRLEKLGEFVDEHPEQAIQVLKGWIAPEI